MGFMYSLGRDDCYRPIVHIDYSKNDPKCVFFIPFNTFTFYIKKYSLDD